MQISRAAIKTGEPSSGETTVVYYDGACPLCRREVAWYRARPGGSDIDWFDVGHHDGENVAPDLRTTDALRRLHVRSRDGGLLSGARAFAELWLALPRLRIYGRLLRLPGIIHIAEWMYGVFLAVRPLWRRAVPRG